MKKMYDHAEKTKQASIAMDNRGRVTLILRLCTACVFFLLLPQSRRQRRPRMPSTPKTPWTQQERIRSSPTFHTVRILGRRQIRRQ